METQENETLFTYITTTVKNSKQPQDFLDINNFSIPKQSELKERCKINIEKYRGNYLVVLGLFLFMFVILNPVILPLIVLWAVYFFFINTGEQRLVMKGYVIRKEWVLKGMAGFSIVYILCAYWVFVSLLATTSLFGAVVMAHMLLFYEKENDQI